MTAIRFTFDDSASMEEVAGTLHLARIAAESLHGEDRVRLETAFVIDRPGRACIIDAACEAGRTLALIFGGYARREFGGGAVCMEHVARSRRRGRMKTRK